jgi:hypothetical protein
LIVPAFLNGMDVIRKAAGSPGLVGNRHVVTGYRCHCGGLFVEKKSFDSLRLNTLGAKRFYLWAWLLPIALVMPTGILTMLFGIAKLDFTLIREAMMSPQV